MSSRPDTVRRRVRDYMRADPQEMAGHQLAVFLVTGAILAVVALVAVASVAGFRECWDALRGTRWKLFALAPVALVISHVGYTIAYRAVARVADGPALGKRDATALVVAGFGPFNPRGGFAGDARGLSGFMRSSTGGPTPESKKATLRVLVLGVLEYAVLAPMTWVAALWLFAGRYQVQDGLLPSWLIGVPAGGVMTLAGWVAYRRIRRQRRVEEADARGFRAIGITLKMVVTWPGGTVAWVGMAVYWAGEIALLGICMAAVGSHRSSVAAVTVAYATGYALTRRTLPLAGAGPVEAILPFALAWVSYSLPAGVVAVAGYRLFNLWLTIPPSALALRHLRRAHRVRRGVRLAAPLPAPDRLTA